MPGDRALSMLIDIRARDSASSIVRMLSGVFSGFGLVAKQAGLAFGLFGEAKNLAGMAQLAPASGHTSPTFAMPARVFSSPKRQIRRAHVCTPVTQRSRMPSSAFK